MGSQPPGSANGDEEFDLTGARFGGAAKPAAATRHMEAPLEEVSKLLVAYASPKE